MFAEKSVLEKKTDLVLCIYFVVASINYMEYIKAFNGSCKLLLRKFYFNPPGDRKKPKVAN